MNIHISIILMNIRDGWSPGSGLSHPMVDGRQHLHHRRCSFHTLEPEVSEGKEGAQCIYIYISIIKYIYIYICIYMGVWWHMDIWKRDNLIAFAKITWGQNGSIFDLTLKQRNSGGFWVAHCHSCRPYLSTARTSPWKWRPSGNESSAQWGEWNICPGFEETPTQEWMKKKGCRVVSSIFSYTVFYVIILL